ncbi:metal ABC transporter solute-binding protein, Zn/Mn family [Virgibacillus salinus]|uniref:Zinc transport system substrate-binding protein n=1 Tax=Virgibacillus salinus TaxID=553311 RepID=A0A1H0ZKK5_9BACI|nr:zinc ABC transporter substrate-binding protein [Virgibacillus salinus]SDQ27606.1 zinc transport system substrate-binding protein [Virgibacillus salinus]
MRRTHYAFILITIIGIIASGCSSSSDSKNNNDLTLYTSIYPIQYAVERIGSETVNIKSIYPPGVDAHTYEPTSKEMTTIADGDAFIYLGAGMEGFAETAASALDSQDIRLIEIGSQEELFHQDANNNTEHDHSDRNPHIWLDPKRMLKMSSYIKGKLIEMDPENKQAYTKNFNDLKEDLLALDKRFEETLQPKVKKEILVSHAAYGYWEERYDIEQIAISGLSSSDEPSQKELTEIIDLAEEKKLNYVIFEQSGSDKVSKIIQDQIGAEALYIHNLSVLNEEDIENEADYLSLMNKNLEVLDKATN